jgi:hypothetical protein
MLAVLEMDLTNDAEKNGSQEGDDIFTQKCQIRSQDLRGFSVEHISVYHTRLSSENRRARRIPREVRKFRKKNKS